jgi:hypothetical protein
MSIKLNDTQLVLLSAASQRDDHCLVPTEGPKRAQAQRAVTKLLEAGLVREIKAKAGAPVAARRNDWRTYALKLTAAGAEGDRVDETGPSEGEAEWRADHPIVSVDPNPEPGTIMPPSVPVRTEKVIAGGAHGRSPAAESSRSSSITRTAEFTIVETPANINV